jgi:hypothetical protein
VIPGANHTSGGDYGQHKRYDYFVEHLHGIRPPAWSELEAAMTDEEVQQAARGQGEAQLQEEEDESWSEIFSRWFEAGS